MAVPRNRVSTARRNSRRAHHAKKQRATCECTNCGKIHLPHRACMHCGHYNNRSLIAGQSGDNA
ncbi:MAG: 50S ribosomal protein L32 [Simkaniaceae bacterium]|nr:50S ribosomal protein L32 [Simkaniaceae bacterium]